MLPRIIAQPEKLNLEDKSRPHAHITAKFLSVLYILFSIEAGIFLLWLPWQRIWEYNYLLYLYPQLRPIIVNPFFKGAILGLGIDSILMGIHQIIHFKDTKNGFFRW